MWVNFDKDELTPTKIYLDAKPPDINGRLPYTKEPQVAGLIFKDLNSKT